MGKRFCFAASDVIQLLPLTDAERRQLLSGIGRWAEAVIGTEYLTKVVRRPAWYPYPPGLDFHDVNYGFSSRRYYVGFICLHNPGVDEAKVIRLATEKGIPGPDGQLLCIPDFMSHSASQRLSFYEVKPDSRSGEFEGEKKMAFVRAFMQELGLRYAPGTTWDPNKRSVVFRGKVFGIDVTVSFHYKRHEWIQGLIIYHFCIEPREQRVRVPAWVFKLIIAIIIILLPVPEPVPDPVPKPVPKPGPAPGPGKVWTA